MIGTCGWVFALSGERDRALELLDEATRRGLHGAAAAIYAGLGEKDRAIELLGEAYEGRDAIMTFSKVTPELDALRDDARFQELLRRMNFPS